MQEKKEQVKRKWALYPYRLAHHPLCERFSNHVYHIKGHKVCKGCINLYIGFIAGIFLAPIAIFVLNINFWIAFITTNILYIFTPLSVLINLPRILKDFCRFLLGIAMISMLVTIILTIVELFNGFNIWALTIMMITILIYIASKMYFTRLRSRRNEKICRECDQFYLPRCEGMMQEGAIEKINTEPLGKSKLNKQ
ncbi:MAG: hypothetical protein ACTSUP_03385 [Candidatus Heimdallarchaeaceae archaeon]